ncbi:MAG TPA: NnrS family protein [Thiobacillaceae bacterium]|nr:NnrS family protein [Thiobacillaceae bacterium]HNU64726.1 NnrS family protein [Thiobacillaceae bacterium]
MRQTLSTPRVARLAAHPLFLCGFRPFYLATAAYGVLLLALWSAMLAGALPAPAVPGGAVAWHVHELLYGFAMASVAGFLLTAVPEFTGCASVGRLGLLYLSLLWLAGRVAYWLAGSLGIWPAALLNLAFVAWLAALLAPPVWRDPGRPHLSFLYALAALAAAQAGVFFGTDPMAWLYAATGVMMILMIVAMSRISMRLINGMLEEDGVVDVNYLARPPRRNLAVFSIGLFTMTEFLLPGNSVAGWLALAASAALLNLLNDWHIGRALFNRWIFMLYAVYWLMALGYGLIGLSLLADWALLSAGRHLLLAGAMSLAIFAVMVVAGRIHAGYWLDRRPWVPVAVGLIVTAALARVSASLLPGSLLMALSAGLWIMAFALFLWHLWQPLTHPRPDDADGCAEPVRTQETPANEFAC